MTAPRKSHTRTAWTGMRATCSCGASASTHKVRDGKYIPVPSCDQCGTPWVGAKE